MNVLLARIRRVLAVNKLKARQRELEYLDYHALALDRQRHRLLLKIAEARHSLMELDYPIAADGCEPF